MNKLFIQPELFSQIPGLYALQTTRHGGVSPAPFTTLNLGHNTFDNPANIVKNRTILCNHLSIDLSSLVTADQVHGTRILRAFEGGHHTGYDAFITDRENIFLCILTADCFPVLIYDHEHGAAGAAHAGWKGTAANIAGRTIEAMKEHFGTSPPSCLAWIGTGISVNEYEIGKDVADHFDHKYLHLSPNGRFMLDLAATNVDQLLDAGIPDTSIEVSPFCTARNNSDFFSYRKEKGKTGRMITLIGINSPNQTP